MASPILLMVVLLALFAAPSASADSVVCSLGASAGKCNQPQGTAVDFETGRLYVADRFNNRVDVFGPSGAFERAFGWGVKTGASQFEVCTTSCRQGIPGTLPNTGNVQAGKGQFSRPVGVAVDNDPSSPSHHDVYVVDRENLRIEKFDAEGNFILAFGGGVDAVTGGDVCTVESGHECRAGSNGFGEGEFSDSRFPGILVGVAPGGTVYVVDDQVEDQTTGIAKVRLQRFTPSGAQLGSQLILLEGFPPASLAVDSTGDLFVSANDVIRKYEPDGTQVGEIDQSAYTLAVDSADHLFAATSEDSGTSTVRLSIVEYDPLGNPLRRFGYGSFQRATFGGIAPFHSATGDIYVSERESDFTETKGNRVLHVPFAPAGPLILPEPCKADPLGNAKATLHAEVNPEGKATTFDFEYITDEDFAANGNSFSGAHPASSTEESESIGSDFFLHPVEAEIELVPETKYRCRVVATNPDVPSGLIGEEGTFTSLPPLQIGAAWASGVGTEAATLNATVNPLGITATGYFEYVDEATYQKDIAEAGPGHGFDHANKVPDVDGGEEPIGFGAGESPQLGSASLSGLQPGTAYRYRIVASDVKIFPKEVAGPTETLRTYRPGEGALPDGRAWELVSPAKKNSAEVAVPGVAGGGVISFDGYHPIEAAAGSGETITYTSWTSFGNPVGAPTTSQYVATRGPDGWGTENISPFGVERILVPPYRGFSPDLGTGAFVTRNPPLTPEAVQGFDNLYLRDNQTGALQALTTEAPKITTDEFCLDYAGASEDGTRAFFTARGSYAGAPIPEGKDANLDGFSLYEWSADRGLTPLSILPGKTSAAIPTDKTAFGAAGSHCQTNEAVLHNVVSADGKTVFWTYAPEGKEPLPTQLLARLNGEETIQLDAKEKGENAGKGPAGGGVFWAASKDGSKAIFSAPGKLTKDAGAAGQLYRYDTQARTLTDLTPGAIAPEVLGVSGASEDASYLYFAAKGVLSGEEENAAGQKAVNGEANLYLWHEGEGVRFIATLDDQVGQDISSWETQPKSLSARVSPDGHHLAFLSVRAESLVGYDNTIATGAHCGPPNYLGEGELTGGPLCAEAFLYDADTGELHCASCNPTGARPVGPAMLPGWSNPFEATRTLSADGSRLFFESRDALSLADENGKRDVYEFEREGSGSCDAKSPELDPASGGCHLLVSGGKSTDATYLLDASASGRDVFFATRRPLVGWDDNENYDVYDAREGGGFPEPLPPNPPCEGEGCKPAAASAPGASSPATPSFQGSGNAVQHKKHKAKKHRKRAKKHKHKVKKKHEKANHKREAGR
jgi:hypothetical protein